MRVLVIGSGGREHALCWAHRRQSAADQTVVRARQSRHRPGRRNACRSACSTFPRWSPSRRTTRSTWWCRVRKRHWSPASPTRWRPRHRLLRSLAAAAQLEGSKTFTKEICDAAGIPTAHVGALRGRRSRPRIRPPPRRADRGEGRRAGGRQGRGGRHHRSRGAGRDRRHDGRARLRQGRRSSGDRGMPRPARKSRCSPCAMARRRYCSARRRTTSAWATAIPARTPAAWAPMRRRPNSRRRWNRRRCERIVQPALAEMARRGTPFRGMLFAGLMLTEEGAKLIEFNVRFGDPECQVLLLRLQSDLLPALQAACDGEIGEFRPALVRHGGDRRGDGGTRLPRSAGTRQRNPRPGPRCRNPGCSGVPCRDRGRR